MKYTVEELYSKVMKPVYDVYDIFKDYFGENKIDLQPEMSLSDFTKCYYNPDNDLEDSNIQEMRKNISTKNDILVWFPSVTVTNEHDKSINIQDLYVKVTIDINGQIPVEMWGMTWNRATYSDFQFINDYMHSHILKIPRSDFSEFQKPCLGKSPIKETITTLKLKNDPVIWMLFCEELSRSVKVESLKGVPYHNLEQLGSQLVIYRYTCYDERSTTNSYTLYNSISSTFSFNGGYSWFINMIKDFTKYYLKNSHLSFSFINNSFTVAQNFHSFIIDISNAFIDYYNKYIPHTESDNRLMIGYSGFLTKVIAAENEFYFIDDDTRDIRELSLYQGKYVCTFKGKKITLKIFDSNRKEATRHTALLLDKDMAMFILYQVLNIINYRYNGNNKTETTNQGDATKDDSITYYI